MKIKTNFKLAPLLLLSLFLICSFALKAEATNLTLNLEYPEIGGVDINDDQNINQIIIWLYYLIIGISGFSAFFMFVWGGFQWTYSAGNTTAIEEAKNRITSAAIGVLIVLSAYLILQVINPELTTLNLPEI